MQIGPVFLCPLLTGQASTAHLGPMTEQSADIIYPEMLDYAWVRDLDKVRSRSRYVVQNDAVPVTADKLPKAPVNLVLTIIAEALSYEEIREAHLKGADMRRSLHLLMWFDEYLLHKYGNMPDARMVSARFVKHVVNGRYDGLDDSALRDDLLASPWVAPDDGQDYKQPTAPDHVRDR